MPILVRINVVVAACALVTVGCTSVTGTSTSEWQAGAKANADSSKGLFGFLSSVVNSGLGIKEKELKRLVEGGSFQAAADFWVANVGDLSKSSTARAQIPVIANGIGQREAAEAAEKAADLATIQDTSWIEKPGQWPGIKVRIAASESLVKRVIEDPFFVANPSTVPASIRDVDKALMAARNRLRDGAVQAFVAYDHRSTVPFFDAFPVQLDDRTKSALVVRGSALWLKALLGGTEEQARSVVKSYAGYLKAPEAQRMVASALAGVVARERKWGNQRSLSQLMQLMEVLDAAGLDGSIASRSVKIGILRGLNPQADGFRWTSTQPIASTIEVQDLPISALNDWAREVASAKPSQIYVLLDPSRSTVRWQLTSVNSRSGERQVGQRSSPNPEWDVARQEVEEARREYAEAADTNEQTQLQAQQLAAQSGGRSIGILGAMLGSSASSMSVISARRRMEGAESKFASTPDTVRTPVTQRYQSALASFEGVRERGVGVYVVNGASGLFSKFEMNDTRRTSEQMVFGADPTDPSFAEVNARNRAANLRLRQFASGAPYPTADEVWQRLSGATETATTPIARLGQIVREDHAKWSKAAAAERAKARASTEQLEERVLKIVEATK